jgi:hypothetical protein
MAKSEIGYFRRKYVQCGPPAPFHQYWVNRGCYGGRRSALVVLKHRLHVKTGS